MLKKIKFKNSTILLIGVLLIVIGLTLGLLEYFQDKKNKAFSEMNIMLYQNETPDNMKSEEDLEKNKEDNKDDEPNNEPEPEPKPDENSAPKYDYIGILEIPKINLKRGFLDINSRYNSVNYNVTIINGSTFPDQEKNNLILAAHSGICTVCYFDRLYKLSKDDIAYIYYKNIKYTYKIVNIYEVEKKGTVAIYRDYNKNSLTLITCTRNSNTKQTVYIFELVGKENY